MTTFADTPYTPPAVEPAVPRTVSSARPGVASPVARVAGTGRKRSADTLRLLGLLAAVGGAVLAGIGFTGSYTALVKLGFDHGFGTFAYVFPIGVDAGILVLLALDLIMIRRGTPWAGARLVAHLLTGATIVFNANAGDLPPAQDPVGAAMHAVVPVLFIVSAECARRLIIKAADLAAGRESEGVPVSRWILAPRSAFAMYRQMRLRGITSYSTAVQMEKDLLVYREMLDRDTQGGWQKASTEARLPMTMAKYGLTVAQALALPQAAAEEARLRAEAAEAAALDAETRAEQRKAAAEEARLRAAGRVAVTRHEVDAEAGMAAAVADARTRAALQESAALDAADTAEADARRATAERTAAEDREAAAEAAARALATENTALEARAKAAEIDARRADTEKRAAKDREAAAEADARAAVARARALAEENTALETEALIKLTPSERAARKVARMILATGRNDADAVPLAEITDALGEVSPSTASARRKEAIALIAAGYTG
ncbi:DUF2637 domain-containing protein [Streptomyces sp. GMY02]|uniref:DUF2637 domain-containing protein n=1 Tax=Streptomyces sp. GMY02 TaxID=1333528 RepID=UPI001C2CBC82|nr:DUF2637 domain-containing protein [Streptomyces sp. GMY02]QXE35898.1 DUF2637 domain-containing protein [Streptomyces sp. GMY02]